MQKIIIILLCCLAPFLSVKAQTAITLNKEGTAEVWDLAKCLDYAKQNNITLNSLRLSAQTTEQNVVAAKAARYPDLTGSVTQGVTRYNTGVYASSSYGVNSSVALYNGGYINNNIQSQELQQQAANLNVAATENDVTLSITQAYLNVLLAKENIVYQQDVVTTAAAQVKQSQQRYDAGTIAQKDLLELQATLLMINII
jgi:outer membrane protein